MSTALLSPRSFDTRRKGGLAAQRMDDRWASVGAPVRRFSAAMAAVILLSAAVHAAIVIFAVLTGEPPRVPPQQEIAVEIVQDVPKPPPAKVPAPPIAKAATSERSSAEPKPPPAKLEPPKTAQAKVDPIQPEAPKPEAAKAEPPKPAAPKPARSADDLQALESELASLKAEQAALRAAQTSAQAAVPMLRDTGLGPLPDSFQAVALPATTEGVGEAVSYQELVFSQLAKAKGIGRHKGLPGSAGVQFEIDATGRLVDVAVVRKSGIPSLDDEAVTIVRKAEPFPPPPQGAQRLFSANVSFVTEP